MSAPLRKALEALLTAADELDAAIDGTTSQFDAERRKLAAEHARASRILRQFTSEGAGERRHAITLARAVGVIAAAETALADLDAAKRKGYLAEACAKVFAFMDDWRIVQRHAASIEAGEVRS